MMPVDNLPSNGLIESSPADKLLPRPRLFSPGLFRFTQVGVHLGCKMEGWINRCCRTRNSMPLFFAAERKPIPIPRNEFNEGASKLLRQREDVHGVAAAGRVRLRSQSYTEGSDRAATSRDGDVLASVDRIRHCPADDL
jgi:hypothetical protein